MFKRYVKRCVFGGMGSLFVMCLPAAAHADLTNIDVFKNASYTQSSDAAPLAPDGYWLAARILSNTDGDVTAASVTVPGGTMYSTSVVTPQWVEYDSPIIPYSSFSTQFAAGDYGFLVTAGNKAGETATVSVPADDFSTTVPYLTGSSYSGLQHANPLVAHSVTWNPWVDGGGATDTPTFFSVYDLTTGTTVLGLAGPGSSFTGATIAAGLLKPGHEYAFGLDFSSRIYPSGSSMEGTTSSDFDARVGGVFTAVPGPSALLGFGVSLVWGLRRRSVR